MSVLIFDTQKMKLSSLLQILLFSVLAMGSTARARLSSAQTSLALIVELKEVFEKRGAEGQKEFLNDLLQILQHSHVEPHLLDRERGELHFQTNWDGYRQSDVQRVFELLMTPNWVSKIKAWDDLEKTRLLQGLGLMSQLASAHSFGSGRYQGRVDDGSFLAMHTLVLGARIHTGPLESLLRWAPYREVRRVLDQSVLVPSLGRNWPEHIEFLNLTSSLVQERGRPRHPCELHLAPVRDAVAFQ